jgi:type II secretory pathway pseudopilin PulG
VCEQEKVSQELGRVYDESSNHDLDSEETFMPSDSGPDPYEGRSLYQTKAVWRWRDFRGCLIGLIIAAILVILILPAIQQFREAARRSTSKNNLKQIGLALHNYHDTHQTLPPGWIADQEGTPYHGWMYSITPFLDSSPLFNEIDPNVPWNHESIVQHYRYQYPVFLNPSIGEVLSKDGLGYAHYAGNSNLFKSNSMFHFDECTDGLSNTLMVGDIKEGLKAWGTPGNVRDPALGLNKGSNTFGSPHTGGVHFLLMDGSVRFLSENVDLEVLKALGTPAGGEDVSGFFK